MMCTAPHSGLQKPSPLLHRCLESLPTGVWKVLSFRDIEDIQIVTIVSSNKNAP